jgi:hypothetical protein
MLIIAMLMPLIARNNQPPLVAAWSMPFNNNSQEMKSLNNLGCNHHLYSLHNSIQPVIVAIVQLCGKSSVKCVYALSSRNGMVAAVLRCTTIKQRDQITIRLENKL